MLCSGVRFKYRVEQRAATANRVTSERRNYGKFSSGRERLFFNDRLIIKKKKKMSLMRPIQFDHIACI